jgi:hypothetical protein
MTLFGIWTGALRSKSSRSWRISLSSSDSFVLRAGVLVFFADVLRLDVIVNLDLGLNAVRLVHDLPVIHGLELTGFVDSLHATSAGFMQSDLRDLNVFVVSLAEDYCRLFSAWRSDEEPTAGC